MHCHGNWGRWDLSKVRDTEQHGVDTLYQKIKYVWGGKTLTYIKIRESKLFSYTNAMGSLCKAKLTEIHIFVCLFVWCRAKWTKTCIGYMLLHRRPMPTSLPQGAILRLWPSLNIAALLLCAYLWFTTICFGVVECNCQVWSWIDPSLIIILWQFNVYVHNDTQITILQPHLSLV